MNIRELVGLEIDEYQLVQLIGIGGTSAVYRAYQEELDRYVAMKILPDYLAERAEYVERFNREAKTAAALEHPHIVPIYDVGIQAQLIYVAMRLLQRNLNQRLQAGDLAVDGIVQTIIAIADALDYGHQRGVLHRDVKPGNIMFDDAERAYVVDFGIATMIDQQVRDDDVIHGTPAYMAPEQWRDDDLTPAVDQYALAAVSFRALTGQLPFVGDTPAALRSAHLSAEIPTASRINANLPSAVDAVLQRALAKDPAARYGTVREFALALQAALDTVVADVTQAMPKAVPPTPTSDDLTLRNPAPSASAPAARPRTAPPPAEDAPIDRTILMQIAGGGIIGLGVLFALVIVTLLALLVLFAPEPTTDDAGFSGGDGDNQAAPLLPTATAIVGQASVTPAIVLTTRPATPTLAPATGIITGATQRAIFYNNPTAPVRDAAYSPDGARIASAHADQRVRLWDSTGTLLQVLDGHTDVVSALAFSPDSTRLVSGGRDNSVRLWQIADPTTSLILNGHSGAVRDVAFSPDGAQVASAAEDGQVIIWDVATGQIIRRIAADPTRVLTLAYSPDGTRIASGGRNNRVRIWSVSDGRLLRDLAAHSNEVRSLDYSPDGQYLASSSTDDTAKIWNAATGGLEQTLTGHGRDVFFVGFSPDSAVLATGGRDNSVRLWRVSDGRALTTIRQHGGWVFAVSFAPDMQAMVSSSGDGTIRQWQVNR